MMRSMLSLVLTLFACAPALALPANHATLGDFERASAIVVGKLQNVRRLDSYAYAALLQVDRVLEGVAPGPPMRILWEQPLATRPPHFYDGDEVLLAVDVVVPGTISDGVAGASDSSSSVFEVAGGGEAFFRLPDLQSLLLFRAYLSLPPAQRSTAIGVSALVRLVASATLRLREAALERLGEIDALEAKLGSDAKQILLLILANEDQPIEIRRGVLLMIGQQRLVSLRNDLISLLDTRPAVEPEILGALAQLEGGLPADLVERSLKRHNSAVRAAAVRFAAAGSIDDRLPAILRSDRSPRVRAEAARALARRGGTGRLRLAAEGLWDADAVVRGASARAIGERGKDVVPLLKGIVWSGSVQAAEAAVLGLAVAGSGSEPALMDVAARYPGAELRQLAWLAIIRF